MSAELIQESDDLRNKIIDTFLTAVPDIEQRILQRILKLLDDYDSTNGYFTPADTSKKKLLQLQAELENILQKSGYYKMVNIYIADLRKITQNTIDLQKGINQLDIQARSLTDIEMVYVQNTVNSMSESGLAANFIQPVTNVLNEAVTFGNSIQSTRDSLESYIAGNQEKAGKLTSYLTVTARDTVTQLQGAQQQAINNEFEMPLIWYVGGLLKDSRGQCVRWHGMQYLEVKGLQEEIDMAYEKAGQVFPAGHRWSGMIAGTTPKNFLIKRGGWGCLHSAFGVRSIRSMRRPQIKASV